MPNGNTFVIILTRADIENNIIRLPEIVKEVERVQHLNYIK